MKKRIEKNLTLLLIAIISAVLFIILSIDTDIFIFQILSNEIFLNFFVLL